MNIYELRQSIIVTLFGAFWDDRDNARIGYNINGLAQPTLELIPEKLSSELIAIGSIDEGITDQELRSYQLSLWDALNIAIRHELAIEMDKEKGMMDIQTSIDKLKQSI